MHAYFAPLTHNTPQNMRMCNFRAYASREASVLERFICSQLFFQSFSGGNSIRVCDGVEEAGKVVYMPAGKADE